MQTLKQCIKKHLLTTILVFYFYQVSSFTTATTWPHPSDCSHTNKKVQPPVGPDAAGRNLSKGTNYLHQFSWELISEKFLFLFIVYCKCFFFFLQSLNLLKESITDEFLFLLCPCLLWNKDTVLRKGVSLHSKNCNYSIPFPFKCPSPLFFLILPIILENSRLF